MAALKVLSLEPTNQPNISIVMYSIQAALLFD